MEQRTSRLSYIDSLDGVRACAILLVFVWHYFTCQITPQLWGGLGKLAILATGWTWSGVDLFFLLSGFLIGRILIFNLGSSRFFTTFYARRFLRIFPAYYLVLAAFAVVSALPLARALPWLMRDAYPISSYALYFQNFLMARHDFGANWLGVTWSLAIEEQFYLILPLTVFLLPRQKLPAFLLGGILLAPALRAIMPRMAAYVLLPGRMDALLLGVLIAHYHLKGTIEGFFGRRKRLLAALTAASVVAVALLIWKDANGLGGVLNHSCYALLYGCALVWTLLASDQRPAGLLQGRVLRFVGRISYGLYLLHQVMSGLVHGLLRHQEPQLRCLADLGATLLAFALTIVAASLSYYSFEKRLLDFGKRLRY